MDSFDVTRRLRVRADTAAIPTVLLASHDRVSDHVMGIMAGATAYPVKPIAPSTLIQTLRQVLN